MKKKRVDDVNASKSKNNPRRAVRSSKKQKVRVRIIKVNRLGILSF